MRTRARRLWERINQGFWFLPGILSAAAVGLAFLTLWVDRSFRSKALPGTVAWSGGPEGARGLLGAIASSVITVAGVSFSVLIVALTLASSQFGPRLMRNFTRDRGHQISLGVLVGTFLFCLVVLRTVREGTEEFVPHVSVTAALVLAAVSIGVLIFFVHHVASSIQAENVVAKIGADLVRSVPEFFPDDDPRDGEAPAAPEFDDGAAGRVHASASGYLQAIEHEGLLALAGEHDAVFRLERRPGQFVTEGSLIAQVHPADRCTPALAREIAGHFLVGAQRTPTQDIEYAIHQLVEVALRALSPSLNDPFTAIACLDWLGAALGRIAQRSFPPTCLSDGDGRVRLIARQSDFEGVVDAAFVAIRQAARENAAVTIRLLEVLATIARESPAEHRRVLLKHAQLTMKESERAFPEEQDRADARARYEALVQAVAEKTSRS